MTELSLRRHTGIFGLVATVISLTDIPLYFMYTGAPPQWDILTRVLVGIVSSTILIVFPVGFRLVICQGRPQLEWAATVVLEQQPKVTGSDEQTKTHFQRPCLDGSSGGPNPRAFQ
jgi:hypothetical protein